MSRKTSKKWTPEEESLLIETVLTYISENKTQTQAFEDVSSVLDDRTAAACDFHWTINLKSKHRDSLDKAKQKRMEVRYKKKKETPKPTEITVGRDEGESGPKMTEVKSAKEIYEDLFAKMDEVLRMHQAKDDIIDSLRADNSDLRRENDALRKENDHLRALQDELTEMARAFELARKIMTGGLPEAVDRQVFAMEQNGNLNKIK